MLVILVMISQTGDGKSMVCQGPLLSTKITYERQ
jgi:hypothetical protein